MTRAPGNSGTVEAGGYARETAERFRACVACDQTIVPAICNGGWFTEDAACAPTAALPVAWTSDPLPGAAAGTESILTGGARRCYRVASQDCDGVGGAGDCLSVQVNVCWNSDFTSCPC